ncbi:ATP-binding protein [Roseococcus sp.]|uniref:ATP-binding protein n=1 Tax=Roseococcus sp. TaxID=2109646 RepID=UPI003BAD712C
MSAAVSAQNVGATNMYRCSPRQVREFMVECLYEGLIPCVLGSPGIGKSAINHSICDELNLHLIDHRAAGSDPADYNGIPDVSGGVATFAPFQDVFPIASTPVPDGKDGFYLFLDEINSTGRAVQAALYKLLLDKKTGQHPLHPNTVLAAAGNLATDRAIVNSISTALQSRVIWLEMTLDGHEEEFIQDIALKQGWDHRIIGYLSRYPGKLMDFKPDHQDKTFCCPRTWEFMNRLVKGKDIPESKVALYAGTITSGVAVDFVQFAKVYTTLIDVKEVVKDPTGTAVPNDNTLMWATVTHLMDKVEASNFEKISTYMSRFPMDFTVLFFRAVGSRLPHLKTHPAMRQAKLKLAKYLND